MHFLEDKNLFSKFFFRHSNSTTLADRYIDRYIDLVDPDAMHNPNIHVARSVAAILMEDVCFCVSGLKRATAEHWHRQSRQICHRHAGGNRATALKLCLAADLFLQDHEEHCGGDGCSRRMVPQGQGTIRCS